MIGDHLEPRLSVYFVSVTRVTCFGSPKGLSILFRPFQAIPSPVDPQRQIHGVLRLYGNIFMEDFNLLDYVSTG